MPPPSLMSGVYPASLLSPLSPARRLPTPIFLPTAGHRADDGPHLEEHTIVLDILYARQTCIDCAGSTRLYCLSEQNTRMDMAHGTGQTAVRRMYGRLVPLSRMLHNGVGHGTPFVLSTPLACAGWHEPPTQTGKLVVDYFFSSQVQFNMMIYIQAHKDAATATQRLTRFDKASPQLPVLSRLLSPTPPTSPTPPPTHPPPIFLPSESL